MEEKELLRLQNIENQFAKGSAVALSYNDSPDMYAYKWQNLYAQQRKDDDLWDATKDKFKSAYNGFVVQTAQGVLGSMESALDYNLARRREQYKYNGAYEDITENEYAKWTREMINSGKQWSPFTRYEVKNRSGLDAFGNALFEGAGQLAFQAALAATTSGAGNLLKLKNAGTLVKTLEGLPTIKVGASEVINTAVMAMQIQGNQYQELKAKGVDYITAANMSALNAAIQAPMEALSLSKIMKPIPVKGTALNNQLKEMFGKSVTEFVTEFAQEYPEKITTLIAENPNASAKELWEMSNQQEWFKDALMSGTIGGILGGGAGGINLMAQRYIHRGEIEHVNKSAKENVQTALKDGVKAEDIRQALNIDGTTMRVDAEALQTYCQQAGDPNVVLDTLHIAKEDLEVAVQNGETVDVLKGDYTMMQAKDENFTKAVGDYTSFGDSEFTPANEKQRQKVAAMYMQTATEQVARDTEFANQIATIQGQIEVAMKDVDSKNANAVAKAAGKLVTAYAKKYSPYNPTEALKKHPLRFMGVDANGRPIIADDKGQLLGGQYPQIAYHGSPYRFKAFNTQNIGSGEGGAAHGWGLYFALDKEVSQGYKEALSELNKNPINYTIGGHSLELKYHEEYATLDGKRIDDADVVSALYDLQGRLTNVNTNNADVVIKDALAKAEKAAESWRKDLEKAPGKIGIQLQLEQWEDIVAGYNKLLEYGNDVNISREKLEPTLYKVDVPNVDVMLDEQMYFDEQTGIVQKAALELLGTEAEGMTGRQIYNALTKKLGSPKSASLALKEKGVQGISYDGRRDGDCLVVFDDSAVSIIDTYNQDAEGATYKQLGGTESTELQKTTENVLGGGIELNAVSARDADARAYQTKVMREQGLTEQEIKDVFTALDAIVDEALEVAKGYGVMQAWQLRDINDPNLLYRVFNEKYKETFGHYPTRSAFKKNGEYELNFDLGSLCTKRESMDALIQILSQDEELLQNLGPTQMEALKSMLKEEGFLTACDVCFVETKRVRALNDANKWSFEWKSVLLAAGIDDNVQLGKREELTPEQLQKLNEMAGKVAGVSTEEAYDKYIPMDKRRAKAANDKSDLDSGITAPKMQKIAQLMLQDVTLAGEFNPALLLTTAGTDWLFRNYTHTNLANTLASMYGAATAKPLEGFNIYDSLSWYRDFDSKKINEEHIYDIGGFRAQSFTDFNPILFVDYVQMFTDLQVRGLPLHLYTKVPSLVELFGKTGAMMNMSLVPEIVGNDKVHAGLKKDADGKWVYAWANESFPVEKAMELRAREDFSGRVGTIAVGVSKAHIEMMLNDPTIDMIIPYHSSGMPGAVKLKTGLNNATDYTKVQETKKPTGWKENPEDKEYSYDHYLQKLKDPRKAAQAYLDWCKRNKCTPKFEEFAGHENYYKLLENFRGYDNNGQPVLQGPVTMQLTENWKEVLDSALADRSKADKKLKTMETSPSKVVANQTVIDRAKQILKTQRLDSDVRDVMMKRLGTALGKKNVIMQKQNDFFKTYKELGGDSDQVETFRKEGGIVYGFAKDGKIYLNENVFNANTPAHEFTHIWVKVAQAKAPELWKQGVDLLKKDAKGIWDAVVNDPMYQNLQDENAIASEVLSRLVGGLNEEFVRGMIDPSYKMSKAKGINAALYNAFGSKKGNQVETQRISKRLMQWVLDFFNGVRSLFDKNADFKKNPLTYEEFIRMPLKTLWDDAKGQQFQSMIKQMNKENALESSAEMMVIPTKEIEEIKAKYEDSPMWMKAPNGKITRLHEYDWYVVRTESFKRWFGDWEHDSKNASQVVDRNGEPKVMYHQTSQDISIFDPRHDGAGRDDNETPFGIFMKPTANDIGLGDKQMPLFVKAKNILTIHNRTAMDSYLKKNVPGYKELKHELEINNSRWVTEYDVLEDKSYDEFDKWDDEHPDASQEERTAKFNELSEIAEEKFNELAKIEKDLSVKMKNLVDAYFRNSEYDGIHLENDEGSYNRIVDTTIVFKPNQVKSAGKNNGNYDPNNPNIYEQNNAQTTKGQISFGDDTAVISLFKGSDASTVFHEIGHYFVENLINDVLSGNATELQKQDLKKLFDYCGIKVEDWATMSKENKTKAHEKLAEAFETYLMEGKAPQKGLSGVFSRIRDWMLTVYKSIARNPNAAEITDDVRQVFDRMLATDEEIAQVEKINGYFAGMPDFITDNLSEYAKKQLAESILNAKDSAVNLLTKQVMKNFNADRKEAIEKYREEIAPQITDEVKNENLYKASDELYKIFGFHQSAKTLAKKFIENEKKAWEDRTDLDNGYNDGGYGVFDTIAMGYGYASSSEFAHAINDALTEEQEIKKRIDAKVQEKFPDVIAERKLAEETAQKAFYNDESGIVIALETTLIEEAAQNAVAVSKGQAERNKTKAEREERARIIKALAEVAADNDIHNNMNMSQARDVRRFISAERNAAAKAAVALEKKDYETALNYKRIQAYNHALVMQSLKARDIYTAGTKVIRMARSSKRDAWFREEHFAQIGAFLARMGIAKPGYNPSMRTEGLADYLTRMQEQYDNVDIAPWLLNEDVIGAPLGMTLNQFTDVVDAIRNLRAIVRADKGADALLKGKDYAELKQQIFDELSGRPDKWTPSVTEVERPGGINLYMSNLKNMDTFFEQMDDNEYGFFTKLFAEKVVDATDKEFFMMREFQQKLKKARDDWYESFGVKPGLTNDLTLRKQEEFADAQWFDNDLQNTIDRHVLIKMLMYLGSESSSMKLCSNKEGSTFAEFFPNSKLWTDDVNETRNNLLAFLSDNLTEADVKYAQAMIDAIGMYWNELSAVEKRTKGFAPKKVNPAPAILYINGKAVAFEGGYVPLIRRSEGGSHPMAQQVVDMSQPGYSKGIKTMHTNTGATKARDGSVYPLDLRKGVELHSVQESVHDICFRELVAGYRKLMNDKDVYALIKSKLGVNDMAQLEEFLVKVANPYSGGSNASYGTTTMNEMARWARSRTVNTAIALNIKTALQNISNVALYGDTIEGFGYKDVVLAYVNFFNNTSSADQIGIKNFVSEKSAFMAERMDIPDITIREIKEGTLNTNWVQKQIMDVSQNMLVFTDNLSAIPVWYQAYAKKIAEGSTEREAVRFADTVIRRTLGSSRVTDVASFQRGDDLAKLFTVFQSFFITQYNQALLMKGKSVKLWREGKQGEAIRKAFAFLLSKWLLACILNIILSGENPFEEKDPEARIGKTSLAQELIHYPMSQFGPASAFISSMIVDPMLGIKSYAHRGTPIDSAVEMAHKVIVRAMNGAEQDNYKDVAEILSQGAGYYTGTPAQINKLFWNGYDIIFNDMDFEFRDLLKRRPKKER